MRLPNNTINSNGFTLRELEARDVALAYMDARTGKRRLRQLSAAPPATELERVCLAARLRAEGIAAEWMGD